jgi:ADP-heptose:LPS heptosyltransferase
MQKLILTNFQAPGDIVMLTAAVRDLHRCHPNRFLTDVRTSCPALWEHNPHLTPLKKRGARVIECHYPLIHQSNQRPVHFLHGFVEDLNEQLGLRIQPNAFKGDLHLSAEEKSMPSLVQKITGSSAAFWIIVAGGKHDFTIKWWHFRRWQAVVDHFRGKLLFVQVGENGHYHPPLDGVLDLRGRTSLRELIQLVYHAQGVVCPVTLIMHLAAAVECRPGRSKSRPCVVVAGGRESPAWEAYPAHQFIHTVGALPCCAEGGCWRSRIARLRDGHGMDEAKHLCRDVVDGLPRCMSMITPEVVIERINFYLQGGAVQFLKRRQAEQLAPFLSRPYGDLRLSGGRLASLFESGATAPFSMSRNTFDQAQPSERNEKVSQIPASRSKL